MIQASRTSIATCLAVVVLASICDIASRRIPNVLSLGAIAFGFVLQAAVGWEESGARGALHGAGLALAGVVVCGIVPLVSYVRGDMGGGDVKLFAGIGALLGPALGFDAQAFTFAVSIALVLPWRLVRDGMFVTSVRNGARAAMNIVRSKERKIGYAPVKLRPVVMAPVILVGLSVALLRNGVLR